MSKTYKQYLRYFIYCIIGCFAIFGLYVSFYVMLFMWFASGMCGYSNERRIPFNDDLEIINVLYDCGATTSYTNIVYIVPKDTLLNKTRSKRFDKKYKVFSAYKCYSDDLQVKALSNKKIIITTQCHEFLEHRQHFSINKHNILIEHINHNKRQHLNYQKQ